MTAYYNENDPKCAAWLRQLIEAGHIPSGDVDERSIEDVRPSEIANYKQCHFFAGIGGWPHALRLAGWPDDEPVWTGSCPCQPFSTAGKRGGTADERHLWPAFFWLIGQCSPAIVFGEQVASKAGRAWLSGVRADLETLGYGVGAADLCAASVGAPHIRQRLWWVADADLSGKSRRRIQRSGKSIETVAGATCERSARYSGLCRLGHAVEPRLEGYAGHGDGRDESGWDRSDAYGSIAAPGGIRWVANTPDVRFLGRRSAEKTEIQGQRTERSREHTQSGQSRKLSGGSERHSWYDAEFIPCADGKARRIESGLEPLVDGLPERVGLLRGYGNAIVPPLAAAFIEAVAL